MRKLRTLAMTLGCLLVLAAMASASNTQLHALDGHPGAYLLLEGAPATDPLTVQVRFTVEDATGLDVVWPIGLSDSPTEPPGILSLVWTEDRSGWFPVWAVQLQTNADLFGPGVSASKGSGALAGSSLVNLHNVRPQAGHVYQAELSYDPAAGLLSVSMSDLTEDARLFTRSVPITTPAVDTLYPALGSVGGQLAIESITSVGASIPFGATWDLLVRDGDRYTRLALFRLTPDIEMALRLNAHAEYAGHFEVAVEDEVKRHTLAQLPGAAQTEETLVEFEAAELPLGPLTLKLDYVDETGRTWTLGSRSFLNVAATLEVSLADLQVKGDAIHGNLVVQSSDVSVADLPVQLRAAIAPPDAKEGTYTTVLSTEFVHVGRTASAVPFIVPLETDAALFSLHFDVEFGIPVGLVMPRRQFHVLRVD